MTPFPYSIAPSASLTEAQQMMMTYDIRHLPVCENHAVIGVLSDRELRAGLAWQASGSRSPEVGDICFREPLLVDLDARLDVVAGEMAARRVNSAIVMRADKLVGILTTTDVCRLLAEFLRELGGDEEPDVA
jgi:acetoin utilization protein AcuB